MLALAMIITENIDGAEYYREESQPRVLTLMSADRELLAVVSQGEDHLFRIHVYRRGREPGYGGLFWTSVGDPSLTDTLSHAEGIAQARLAAGPPSGEL